MDPFQNIALEHAITQYQQEFTKIPTIRLWYNSKCVMLGRMQNIRLEVNLSYCQEQDIDVVRRISGGGTVYQDPGHLNISFYGPLKLFSPKNDVLTASEGLTRFNLLVLENLGYEKLGIDNGSNILHDGKKISGSANYLTKNWFLHHLTLLHNTDLNHMTNCLLAREFEPVESSNSRYYPTTNLLDFDYVEFKNMLKTSFSREYSYPIIETELENSEITLARNLEHELYRQKRWIFDGKRKK